MSHDTLPASPPACDPTHSATKAPPPPQCSRGAHEPRHLGGAPQRHAAPHGGPGAAGQAERCLGQPRQRRAARQQELVGVGLRAARGQGKVAIGLESVCSVRGQQQLGGVWLWAAELAGRHGSWGGVVQCAWAAKAGRLQAAGGEGQDRCEATGPSVHRPGGEQCRSAGAPPAEPEPSGGQAPPQRLAHGKGSWAQAQRERAAAARRSHSRLGGQGPLGGALACRALGAPGSAPRPAG